MKSNHDPDESGLQQADPQGTGQGVEPARITFIPRFSTSLAAEELYYRTTVYPLLDRILAGLLMGLGVMAVLKAGLVWWALIWFPVAAAELLGLTAAARLALGLMIKRDPDLGLARTVTVTERGLTVRSGAKQLNLPWEKVGMLLEDQRMLLLAWAPWQYVAIPKEAFQEPEDLDAMRALLLERIPAATRTAGQTPS